MEIKSDHKLTKKQYLILGSMLFGLFFGAGNLIFPIHLGQISGGNWLPATLGFLLLTNFSFSQIKKKELSGIWKTNSELFSKTDTIKFYPNIKDCYQTKWTIEKRKFKTNELNICTEPPRISGIVGKEKIKLRKKDFGQIIEYYQNEILTDKFRIIELKNKVHKN